MRNAECNKLRSAIAACERLDQICAENRRGEILSGDFALLVEQARRVEIDFPGLLPPFAPDYFRGRFHVQFNLYDAHRVRGWLTIAIAALRAALENSTADPVVVQAGGLALDFSFVTDAPLRTIIDRDFAEAGRAYAQACWKSVIILSGGIMEALLADTIGKVLAASATPAASAGKPLAKLIETAAELNLVSTRVRDLSDTLRHYRNLVHVGAELRDNLRVDEEEARIALAILGIVKRDLAARRG